MSLLPKKVISSSINIRLKLVEKNKKQTQIAGVEQSFVVKVDIEFGY